MSERCGLLLLTLVMCAGSSASAGDRPVTYSKDIRPFLAKYCLECHGGKEPDGELNLETYKSLRAGGTHGPVLVPGKASESRIVPMVEGMAKPAMPPKRSPQPRPEERALLRAWIDAGAKDDGGAATVVLPEIKPSVRLPAPIRALAYRPDGKLLAAASQSDAQLIEPTSGEVRRQCSGTCCQVTALAFSGDGRTLAVAGGSPSASGVLEFFQAEPGQPLGADPVHRFAAHRDLIHDLAFSPDGQLLASAGYDRVVKLWDVAARKLARELRDHSDAVYGVSFSADGKLLASCGADRAVKVWDVATGKRLYTLGENTDWVYAVAWSPKGNRLAAAGVDRSIRVWEATGQGGKVVHSVFAHEAPVLRLAWSADGGTLYSLSDDRTAKAWDAARMVERLVYPRQPDTPLSLAVRPDNKQIAIGGFDGALVLLDAATGKEQGQPLPVKPKPPELKKVTPSSGPRGQNLKLRLEGANLAGASEVTTTIPGAKVVLTPGSAEAFDVILTVPPTTAAGTYQLAVKHGAMTSGNVPFIVDLFPAVTEDDRNDAARTAQPIRLPATVVGLIGRAGDVDFYRFEATAGQEIGVQALASAIGSKLEPVLTLTDASGRVLAESTNGLLGHRAATAGTLVLGVRDRDYRGEPAMTYRLQVGPVPIVTSVFPLGVQRGTEAEVQLDGVNLAARTARVKAPATVELGQRLPITVASPLGTPLGDPGVVAGEFPEVVAGDRQLSLAVPATGNGRIAEPGAAQTWRFSAKKGQRLVVETHARRLGSPLDSTIEILDSAGKPIPRATLRSQAKTYVVFRDHDSASTGIRIETWSELAVNDHLLVGGELVRIRALPRNPDDDCQFFSESGRRIGYLGTTPTHHPMGLPMYKVAIHPPGATFPPNGLPVVTIYHRNDDGGGRYDKDSALFFDPPADGEYQVRVTDSRGFGGSNYVYRLTIRPPRPSFSISLNASTPTLAPGEGVPLTVAAERLDGFEGPIELRAEGLPAGFIAPATTILPDDNSTNLTLFAEPGATIPAGVKPWKIVSTATVDGKTIVREAAGEGPKLRPAPELAARTDLSEVTLRPGGETRLTVHVDRRNGFKGRVPVEVKGLPHGVRVLDVGLNGILITERDTSRVIVLHAEPWVRPTDHPIVVLARHETKGTEHAARSVLLRVAGR